MAAGVIYRLLAEGEEAAACALARQVFDRWVAPDYPPAGVGEFHRYADPAALAERLAAGHFVVLAVAGGRLAGVAEVREDRHLAMLFVASGQQGRGIGRGLFRRALDRCRAERPDLARMTVHAAPAAVPFYSKLGFRGTAPERTEHGIRFVPMALELRRSD